jgi:hypothetical protein
MVALALLSNPRSTGNITLLPSIRSFCAGQAEIFHYEVEDQDQIADALEAIARVNPRLLVVNGGDGTVQTVLTELYHGNAFGGSPPPVSVLPNGKTNLIALDLGVEGDPVAALERMLAIATSDLDPHLVTRELIALTEGEHSNRPVLGMFLGGAGLADTILYCRHKIYPMGLPNAVSHVIAGIATVLAVGFGITSKFLPPKPLSVRVSLAADEQLNGKFAFLIVTTLEKLVMGGRPVGDSGLKLMAVDRSGWTLARAALASLFGKLSKGSVPGVHLENGNIIRIESDSSSVILDGEEFRAIAGRPIVLRSTAPVNFLRLAA